MWPCGSQCVDLLSLPHPHSFPPLPSPPLSSLSPEAYEQAVREQRIRTEVSQVKRENAFYLKNVEKSKAISAIIERKRKHTAEGSSEVGHVTVM